jgi:hypothetical protein
MNGKLVLDGIDPFEDPVDRLLAEIALELQLPPSLHDQVDDRYAAVRRKLEETAVFGGDIEHFYPQGSMAIDATISSRGTDDEYDLDIIAQLGGRFRAMSPLAILLELERALKDYPVQRVTRQTRCVTLHYADRMHLDITPAIRRIGAPDRESLITHAKGPIASVSDHFVDTNAYGFVGWYRQQTPIEPRLAKSFNDRWRALDQKSVVADAEVDEVPDQTHFTIKNVATLALQLLKRFRNIRYTDYDGRIPPSVMLSFYAAQAARPNMRLSDMVVRIANWIIQDIAQATLNRVTLHVANPVCLDDVLTDRWPESLAQQNEFANHLRELVQGLEAIQRKVISADVISKWLREQFGSRVVTRAADRMAAHIGSSIQRAEQSYSRKGKLLVPASGVLSGTSAALVNSRAAASTHTFYGKKV